MLSRKGKIVIESIEEVVELSKTLPERFKFELNISAMKTARMKESQTFFDENGIGEISLKDRIIDTPKIKNIYLIMQ